MMQNDSPAKLSDLNLVFGNFLNVALGLVATISVIMLLVGGFQFISAGGDKESSTKARSTITFAIMGLIIAVSAWMIINIFGGFLGIQNPSNFSICLPDQIC